MRNKNLRRVMLLVLLGTSALRADNTTDDTAVAPARSSEGRPEYQAQPLFDDVFVPSKELPEDQPTPFPVDS
jgi:hypothetical protein